MNFPFRLSVMLRKQFLLAAFVVSLLFLFGCATKLPPRSLDSLALTPDLAKGTSKEANELQITLFPMDLTNEDRSKLYTDASRKGYLPLQISILNPTNHSYSLEKVQYAICDPSFKRTRRINAKSMALMETEIIYSEEAKKGPFWKRFQKARTAKKMKTEYEKFEFQNSTVLPYSQITGWLYFQVKDGEFDMKDFFSSLKGYQLEIAHIKDLSSNIISNVYLELSSLAAELEAQP